MGRTRSRRPSADKAIGKRLFGAKATNVLVPNRASVNQYLSAHPMLSDLLSSVCRTVRQAFGPCAELSLEMYRDPEIDDRYLTLYVRLEKYDSGVPERIDAVRRQFEQKLEQVSGDFLLTTDFRPRRGNHAV